MPVATVTTTAQRLTTATAGAPASVGNKNGILLRAPTANGAIIAWGKADTVTASGGAMTKGITLEPGEAYRVMPYEAPDASAIWVIAASGSQALDWTAVEP